MKRTTIAGSHVAAQSDANVVRKLRRASSVGGVVIAALGVVAIVGWTSGVTALRTAIPALPAMKFNSAVGFAIAGLSISALGAADESRLRRIGRAATSLYGLLGLLTLGEYAFNSGLGFDNPFGLDTAGANPGRMAATSAACFVALAISVLALDRRRNGVGQTVGLAVVVIAWLAVIGYVFGVISLYNLGNSTPMALNTAIGFVIAGVATLFARPDRGFVALLTGSNAGGSALRRLLAPALIGPMVIGGSLEWAARTGTFTPDFRSALFTSATMLLTGTLIWIVGNGLRHVDLVRADAEDAIKLVDRALAEREQALKLLAASEESHRATQRSAPIGLALVGLDGRFQQVNPALCELFGRSETDLLSRTFQELSHPNDLEASTQLVQAVLRGEDQNNQLEKRYLRPNGQVVWASLNVAVVRVHDEPHHFVSTMLDITARKQLDAELETAAATDALTGAFNRRRLDTDLAKLCRAAQRHDDPVAVLMIDVDHFKSVNDQYGHLIGDRVLTRIAQLLQLQLRAEDILGRWGGEEFLALLPRTDRLGALAIAERLRAAVADGPVPLGDLGSLPITVSIGVAAFRGLEPNGLIARADRALYDAKVAGRNRVAVGVDDERLVTL